jgi:hypothetical protein
VSKTSRSYRPASAANASGGSQVVEDRADDVSASMPWNA